MSEGAAASGGARPAPSRPALGRAAAWSRDLAIVGASTSFLSASAVAREVATSYVVGGVIGGVVGALFGILLRRLLLAWLHRPIVAWIPISLVLGGALGATISVATMVVMGDRDALVFCGVFGALAGAIQLSWFWLPYAVRAGRGKSTWPIVTAAVVIGGAVGYAALYLVFAILRPHVD
jgi:hypothetical protein